MDCVKVIGFAAAVMVTAANIPQAVKMFKEKSTRGISSWSYAMFCVGGLLWVLYGIWRSDLPIILSNGLAALLSGLILAVRIFSKRPDNDFKP